MLKQVTITGADDKVRIPDLLELHRKYPFLELGILVGTMQGIARFPTTEWIQELVRARADINLKLSLHVCGGPLREIVEQGSLNRLFDERKLRGSHLYFKRIQLNLSALSADPDGPFKNVGKVASNILQSIARWDGKPEVIFQNAGQLDLDCMGEVKKLCKASILFDASGGRGVCPLEWPQPVGTGECGWSGGLGPHNLVDELPKIHSIVNPGRNFWIDSETGCRENEELSLDRCDRFLSVADKWIQTTKNR